MRCSRRRSRAGSSSSSPTLRSSALTALIATGYTVSSSLRLHVEETSGRVEPLLATSIGRLRWDASHVVMSLAGSAIVLTATGLGAGLAGFRRRDVA